MPNFRGAVQGWSRSVMLLRRVATATLQINVIPYRDKPLDIRSYATRRSYAYPTNDGLKKRQLLLELRNDKCVLLEDS